MRIFAIKDEELPSSGAVAFLLYYERSKSFYIELPEGACEWETPLLLSSFLRRGEHTINAYWSKMWVRQRIVPTDRQNLGEILKVNGMDEYDEFELLISASGRCAQDSCYIEETDMDSLPDDISARRSERVEDVLPLAERGLLLFFRDGTIRKCDAREITNGKREFLPVMQNEDIFRSVSVQPDGYGIYWGEQTAISHTELYVSGITIPLTFNDFRAFAAERVIGSTEAADILDCSRQNIDDLTKRGKLHPIKADSRTKLYLKSEVTQRKLM